MFIRNRFLWVADLLLIVMATVTSFVLRFDTFGAWQFLARWWLFVPLALVVYPTVFYLFGLYRRVWQYAGSRELVAIILASTLSTAILSLIVWGVLRPLHVVSGFSRPVMAIQWLLSIVFLGGDRLAIKVLWDIKGARKGQSAPLDGPPTRVLIAGAGSAGAMILREMQNNPSLNLAPIGFVDDDDRKLGQYIHSVKVLGSRDDIPRLARAHRVDEVIIAMPTAPGSAIRAIVNICDAAHVRFRTLPGLFEILNGTAQVSEIREVQLEDLLRRAPTRIDLESVAGFLSGATVLITGAGGSIGAELCRQVARFKPKLLLLLGHGENSIYAIDQELNRRFEGLTKQTIIADVRNRPKIDWLLQKYRPDVVFHSAAHKHVPLMEQNCDEAVTNNVMGTVNMIEASIASQVKRFVMVSTDKAVHPTSIMGATKRVTEMLIQDAARRSGARFVAVRFGNVLGSRGSVVPLFREQIQAGGPITITHPDMTRYFMTIPEAVQLVIQAAAVAQGGAIYALDMGEPVRILDLAKDLVELSGLELGKDVDIVFTGLRPGEKLSEELFTSEELHTRTDHDKIMMVRTTPVDGDVLRAAIDHLAKCASAMDDASTRQALHDLIPDFDPGAVPPPDEGQ